ncbi:MAG: Sulfite exporter TauE/SafE/YfcA [Candidatus Alkanophagales archaeon MCA70_species_2]|nr:Sulfite exporter TauE/SafE/YfcA [Candidatus Alkanophaga liquidiphilum]
MLISAEMVTFMVVAGAFVGLISSFFGVGACFIMVPVMIYCFEKFFAVNPSLSALIAFGTNMAVVVPTALSGALRHRKELRTRGFGFPTAHYVRFGIPVGIGSLIGAIIAFLFYEAYPKSAGIVLKTIFGVFCLFGAYRFMMAKPLPIEELKPPSTVKYAVAGLLSAIVAHFIGIGGGIVYMPVLNSFLGVPVHLAIPISLASMCIGSSVGALSFASLGHLDQLRNPTMYPPLSFGWFNLTAFAFIGVTSILFAQLGPRLAHRTSPQRFKILLAILYVYIGIRLILRGIYQLQGLVPPLP